MENVINSYNSCHNSVAPEKHVKTHYNLFDSEELDSNYMSDLYIVIVEDIEDTPAFESHDKPFSTLKLCTFPLSSYL